MANRFSPAAALAFLWLLWIVSWAIAAAWTDRTVKRAGRARQAPYNILTIIGVLLLFGSFHRRHAIIWPIGRNTAWSMVALAAIGFAFTWWARVHLGRMWSRWVVRKADHRIIQTGPYALVRHPIYTGISLAIVAAAVMAGNAFAYLGAALMIFSFYLKAKLEERFLREELGAEAYDGYARRVPMLIPFLKI
jgi:protein-S-isoprenylcysteine O-methyltransferase Ste14